MPTIYLIEGPVGAGKSTFAAKLSQQTGALRMNLDEWMVTLFSPDRPETDFLDWYQTCKQRCINQIWHIAGDLNDLGQDVILELGLVQQADRESFYQRIEGSAAVLRMYVLQAPKETRRQRVAQRNKLRNGTYQMTVSDEIFEIADAAWQHPSEEESSTYNINWINAIT